MNRSPAQQWSELSALYEHADGLAADALAAWLARLEREGNALLPQLRLMLAARAEFETNDFLGTLPKIGGTAPRAAAPWAEGRTVGAYRLLRPLGEGGMAEVWLAERADGVIKRRVAIKLPFPRPGRETFAVRFDRERDILATLRHPNIAGLYDAGVTPEGQAWLALEYVDGEPLSDWCDEQHLPLRERVRLFRQVLLAVQHAHANLVIHRDLKPANILVTPQGEVRLLDFGIAKLLEAEGDAIAETELTRQAGRTMTPRYASPEQLTGAPLTTACDVYSLGVVFYELLSGERPYELKVETAGQLEHAILELEPRAPSRRALTELHARDCGGMSVKALRKALAPELDAIVLRCLAKQPAARYASVDAVIADIDRWLGGEAVLARAPGAWYRFRKFAARHRVGVALGAAAVAALVATTAVAVAMGLQAREESARAVAARDFMLDIFKRADQEKSRGADITARDILETGRKDVLTRLAGQPRLQADLLQGIGEIQRDMGEFPSAARTYAEVASLFAQLAMPRETALALADQAEAALNVGDLKSAAQLMKQARSVPRLPSGEPAMSARLGTVDGWIFLAEGNLARAKDEFAGAEQQAIAAFGEGHADVMPPLKGLVYVERQLGEFDDALHVQRRLEQIARRAIGNDADEWAILDESRVATLYEAGRYALGLPDALGALARCRAAQKQGDEYCRRIRLEKMRLALRLGRLDDMADDLRFVDQLSQDPGSLFLQADALTLLSRMDSLQGTPMMQSDALRRLRALCCATAGTALSPPSQMLSLLALAEAALRSGAGNEARQWLDQAARVELDMGTNAPAKLHSAALLLSGMADLRAGRYDVAVRAIETAQRTMARETGPTHPLALMFGLDLAIARAALGQDRDALQTVQGALPGLEAALGVDSSTYQRVIRLRDQLRLRIDGLRPAQQTMSDTLPTHDFFN